MLHDIVVTLPREYAGIEGHVKVKHEEEAVCWLWAYPELFPWDKPLAWICSPVTGKKRWPGDLWGIDANGDLLAIECKRVQERADPFVDFVTSDSIELEAEHWREKFQRHLDSELRGDIISERKSGETDGIVPRSNKRSAIRRWSVLADRISTNLRDPSYRSSVLSYLGTRKRKGNPTPYFAGLMAISDPKRPLLSDQALASHAELERKVGRDNVFAVAISAQVIESTEVRISAVRI